jgi:hypothetical protein
LDLRIPSLGLIQDLAEKIDWALDLVDVAWLLTLDHDNRGDHAICGRNVEIEDVVLLLSGEDWRGGKELF